MRRFAQLYATLDATTSTSEKVDAIVVYLRNAEPADAAWAIWFLAGNRPKRLLSARRLAEWAMVAAEVPAWLFEESYAAVGDLAETITLLLPHAESIDWPLSAWIQRRLLPLAGASEDAQRCAVLESWRELGGVERFVCNKLITGSFRVGVSHNLVTRALSRLSGIAEPVIAHRLSGSWEPSAAAFASLISAVTEDADHSRPYPFFLAYPIDGEPEQLGDVADWQLEWKWDGIRAQLLRREGETFLWSRGDELITDRFPELREAAALLPNGTVLDGEILPWRDGHTLGFAQLQRRIGRRQLGGRILSEIPVVLMVYDVLEVAGDDVRPQPLRERRALLERLLATPGASARFLPSPIVRATNWTEVRGAFANARAIGAEGLMIKRADAAYGVGRRRGSWWKWKLEPFTVDAVMIYAQAGHGRRASLHTDYTFAVWDGDTLVPFAKAYSGLTDAEIRQLDAWIRTHTREKFGPVRSVEPMQVFELGFEGIRASSRHKSGVAVRFPRILRWRTDKRARDADTLASLRALLVPA